jgi:hypothetical protein
MWQKWLVKLLKDWREWEVPPAYGIPAHFHIKDSIDSIEKEKLHKLFEQSHDQLGKPWWDGFSEYDYYLRFDNLFDKFNNHEKLVPPCFVDTSGESNPRWAKFNSECDALIEGLQRAGKPPEK